jgi:hypothetical protein
MDIIERIKTDQFFTHEYVLLDDDTFMDEIWKRRFKHFSRFLPPNWLDNEILKNRIVYCFQVHANSILKCNDGTYKTHILDERTKQNDMMIKIIEDINKSEYFQKNNLSYTPDLLLRRFMGSIANDSQALRKIIMENGGGMHQMGFTSR